MISVFTQYAIAHPFYFVMGLIIVGLLISGFGMQIKSYQSIIPAPVEEEIKDKDLKDGDVRASLTRFLAAHNIKGNANIREGIVETAIDISSLPAVLARLENAVSLLRTLPNPNSCSFYIRDSVNDRFMLVRELDVRDLSNAIEAMRAQVAAPPRLRPTR